MLTPVKTFCEPEVWLAAEIGIDELTSVSNYRSELNVPKSDTRTDDQALEAELLLRFTQVARMTRKIETGRKR